VALSIPTWCHCTRWGVCAAASRPSAGRCWLVGWATGLSRLVVVPWLASQRACSSPPTYQLGHCSLLCTPASGR
jgi:hypothetical protein